MKLFISDKISTMGDSIFSVISQMANEYKATNFGQGFPDFDGPEWIIESMSKAAKDGKNQYAPSPGIMSLRQVIADYHKSYYNQDWDPSTEITVTTGATEALYSTITAFINPGDEVVMFEPFYDAYYANVQLAGGICKFVTLKKPDFSFDFDEFENAITNKTKLIILNSPHNPSGKVFNLEELSYIAKIALEKDLIVISDEVYEFLTFDGKKHIPISTLEGMKKRTITISSTGKTFSMTGWKIGYAIASAKHTEAIRKVHQWVTFAVNTPAQHSMADALSRLDSYLPDFREMYSRKMNYLNKEMKNSKFTLFKPSGTYFAMVEFPNNIFNSDIDASTRLIKEYGIATIPTSVFYKKSEEGKQLLRLCFAKTDEVLKLGIEKLKKV